jgi:hypothetical protein
MAPSPPGTLSQSTTIAIILIMVFLLAVVLLSASFLHRYVQKRQMKMETRYVASVPAAPGRRRWMQFHTHAVPSPMTSEQAPKLTGDEFIGASGGGGKYGGNYRGDYGDGYGHSSPQQCLYQYPYTGEEVRRPERVYEGYRRMAARDGG